MISREFRALMGASHHLLGLLGICILASLLVLGVGACAAPAATPTLAPAASATVGAVSPTIGAAATQAAPTVAAAATQVVGMTAGALTDQGKNVFASSCAGCHGAEGQGVTGPPLIGPNARFARFNNAQQLLDYTSSAMPMNSPGSLTRDQYLQVTAYMLVQNNLVQPVVPLTAETLSTIRVQR